MHTLIKALLKPHMQLYYIFNGIISQLKIFILTIECHIRCCIIHCITIMRLNSKNHMELKS